jgi:hypothetical protein
MNIAECTGMDKAFKIELIHAMCLKEIEQSLPGIDSDKAKSLAKIRAESMIFSRLTHRMLDEIINEVKESA